MRSRATTVEAAIGRVIDYDTAAQRMAQGFAQALNLQLDTRDLISEEQAWVEELRREKYAAEEWTYRL
ncbi:MAG: hypothetical protein HGB05_04340 [Chloroflexi bacterium]|nr:hypothetical protein [Chloroflexota bacterium]